MKKKDDSKSEIIKFNIPSYLSENDSLDDNNDDSSSSIKHEKNEKRNFENIQEIQEILSDISEKEDNWNDELEDIATIINNFGINNDEKKNIMKNNYEKKNIQKNKKNNGEINIISFEFLDTTFTIKKNKEEKKIEIKNKKSFLKKKRRKE